MTVFKSTSLTVVIVTGQSSAREQVKGFVSSSENYCLAELKTQCLHCAFGVLLAKDVSLLQVQSVCKQLIIIFCN